MRGDDQTGGRRRVLRPVTVAVLTILLVVAGASALVVRRVVDDQERRILQQRGRELSTLMETLASSIQSALRATAAIAAGADSPDDFVDGLTQSELQQQLGDTIVLVDRSGDGARVLTGFGLEPGDELDAESADAVGRANDQMAGTGVVETDGGLRLGFAMAVPGSTGEAVFISFPVDPSGSPVASGEPFADLEVAIYASPSADDGQLIVTSGSGEPPSGPGLTRTELDIGQETWLIETSARSSLVGSAAEGAPWVVLGSGVVVAGFAAALVEVLLRRQSYAVAMVEERTAELEAARVELEAADAMKDEFLANVSHELRTPLTAVNGFAELLTRPTELDGDTRRQLTDGIRRNARAMQGMVERLLDYTRLTAGRVAFEARTVDLGTEITNVVAAHDYELEGREVNVEVPPGLTVRSDPAGLAHIVGNLLSNAAKYSPTDEPIDIVATADDEEATVRVVDRGPGVPAATANALFDRFVQGRDGQTRHSAGFGLGLAIAKRYVDLHGGRIWFDPPTGRGASVAFVLPRASAAGVES